MAREFLRGLLLSSLLIAVTTSAVFSARKAPERRQYNPFARVIVDYALTTDEPEFTARGSKNGGRPNASLGASVPSASPGNQVGDTYREYQANSSQGRMLRTGRSFDAGLGDSLTIVHFGWYDLPGPSVADNGPAYNFYDASSGAYGSEVKLTFSPESAPFNNMEVSPDNKAMMVGHYSPDGSGGLYTPAVWYDDAPGDQGFSKKATVDSALWKFNNPYLDANRNTIWPHVAFQRRPTGQHITHIAAVTFNGGIGQNIGYYFRKEGAAGDSLHKGTLSSCPSLSVTGWDCPRLYDTLQGTTAMVDASKKSGKMALFWTTTVPYTGNDTNSVSDLGSVGANRTRSDAYYQSSNNYGVTLNPKVNVTHTDTLVDDWAPAQDIDGLWTGEPPNEEFHMVWNSWHWKRFRQDGFFPFSTRVFHWSESYPGLGYGPRAVMTRLEDPTVCNAVAFNLNLSKINVAQCNNNLYVTAVDNWEGHVDPLDPDCSKRGIDGDASGSVNGEIVVAISDNNGVSWDLPHNLTNSPTPNCDSVGGLVGPCACDHWPSMIPLGVTTRAGDDWTGTIKLNPRPAQSYPDVVGVQWLDVQYVQDLDPGNATTPQGRWTNSPIRHFRMACVNPDQVPVWNASITEVAWPTYLKATQTKDVNVVIENSGNSPLNQTISTEEDSGPAGWLTTVGIATFIDEGLNNTDAGIIRLSASSITQAQVNAAGGSLWFYGRVIFNSDAPSDIDTIPVTMVVTDTIRLPNWDTIHTGVISLAVATDGRFGGGGDAGMSNVRLDFYDDPLECDKDTLGPKLGDTRYYLYDGSFAVGGIVGVDTIMSNQIFDQGLRTPSSVYQTVSHVAPATSGVLSTWNSGKMVNHDSSLAFNVRWVAPQVTQTWGTATGKTWHADQNFVTRELKIWPNKGVAVTGLAIGDAIDWDIPADSGSDNKGEVDATKRLIYLKGGEYNQDNATECQNNDTRYGGMAYGFLRAYWNHDNNAGTPKRWTVRDSVGYGGYAEANARYVYPGWKAGELYANMEGAVGYIPWTHTPPDSQQTDLHAVLTAAFNYDVAVGDTVAIYTVYSSVRNDASVGSDRVKDLATKGRNFTYYFTCCNGTRGDLNGDGAESNVLDLTFAVDRIFRGQPPSACPGEADVNRDKSVLDVVDMTFLVDRIFRGGAAPAACSVAPTI